MSTNNKRVAAYLPEPLAAKFEAYKAENNLGDSSALIAILSQFLGVTHSVAQSNSDYSDILDKRISQLKYDLKSELLGELKRELLLFRKSPSKLPSESLSESPLPIVGAELSSLELKEYLKINSNTKNLRRDVSRAAARLGQRWESLGAQVWHRIQ